MGFVRIEGGVNSSENHVCASIPCQFPDFVAAESICGVDADANNIARLNLVGVHGLKGFIDQAGIAKARRGSRRQNIQPARSNYSCAERNFTGINEVNAHAALSSWGRGWRSAPGRIFP